MSSDRVPVFAVAAPGLEALVLAEVVRLGVANAKAIPGGVAATATWPQVWSMNLHLRIATRVLVRVARFDAVDFAALHGGIRRIDWAAWLPAGARPVVSAAASQSKLFHTEAIAERVIDALPAPGDGPEVDVLVRIARDAVTVSLDSSGEALHKRGWREQVAKAPMRETLAAALLAHSGWDGKAPLVDPFCGSGTIVIEAALMARRVPPGRHRRFAFEELPSFDASRWQRLLAAADADVLDRRPVLVGSDRDDGAIAAALANAERAGAADLVVFERRSLSDIERPSPKKGWIVTNPPYGHRVDGAGDLRNLAHRLAAVASERFAGWTRAVSVTADSPFVLRDADKIETVNGGIPIVLARS